MSSGTPPRVVVSGGFDDLRSGDLRFLQEAARLGEVTVWLWPDELLAQHTGKHPKFPFAERRYVLQAVRYVSKVVQADLVVGSNALPKSLGVDIWADYPPTANREREKFCRERGLHYQSFPGQKLAGFPESSPQTPPPGRKKVMVTGCYDWFHSGHVRFFEEVSAYGDLYVVIGHDANIRLLKGEGHPLLPEAERRYLVSSIKYVHEALISSGHGWLDADPEIRRLQPDIYAVNEDGDKGGKREYCEKLGIQFLVLKRVPAPGLTGRSSTDLRGF
jgi:cytidyltransferase-like protein